MAVRKKQSKRLTTRHRAKVDRKLREHHRKVDKSSGALVRKKARKDPGIPNNFPGKEEFVRQMQAEKEKEKMQRKMAIARNDLRGLAHQAASRSEAHGVKPGAQVVGKEGQRFFDSSKRAFYREFNQVVNCSDVILVVLDARDPEGCRVKAVEELVAASGGQKRLVLVLNKIDLVPRDVVTKWLAHLRKELPAVAFKSSTHGNASVGASSAMGSSECLGADMLIQLLKNYCRNLNIKTSIRVGVIGYPNVGKSSLINSLKRSKVCKVGATPGVTTASQEIHLDRNIKLLDCPGIVFASPSNSDELAHLFLRNCVKVEQLEDPLAPIELILQKTSTEQLMMLYAIPRFGNINEFLCHIAHHQGKLKKGGIPNVEAAAKSILIDWNQGKIPFYTLPPPSLTEASSIPSISSAEVVTGWAPAFDLDSLIRVEQELLKEVAEIIPNAQRMDFDGSAPRLVVAAPVSGATKTSPAASTAQDPYHVKMTEMEMSLNPQLNKNRAKALKQARKTAQKQRSLAPNNPSNSMDVDE